MDELSRVGIKGQQDRFAALLLRNINQSLNDRLMTGMQSIECPCCCHPGGERFELGNGMVDLHDGVRLQRYCSIFELMNELLLKSFHHVKGYFPQLIAAGILMTIIQWASPYLGIAGSLVASYLLLPTIHIGIGQLCLQGQDKDLSFKEAFSLENLSFIWSKKDIALQIGMLKLLIALGTGLVISLVMITILGGDSALIEAMTQAQIDAGDQPELFMKYLSEDIDWSAYTYLLMALLLMVIAIFSLTWLSLHVMAFEGAGVIAAIKTSIQRGVKQFGLSMTLVFFFLSGYIFAQALGLVGYTLVMPWLAVLHFHAYQSISSRGF